MENILEIYENQASLKYASYFQHSEFARTLFPVESTSNIKIKITHHRVIGDRCICQRISEYYQVLYAVTLE